MDDIDKRVEKLEKFQKRSYRLVLTLFVLWCIDRIFYLIAT